MSAGGTIYRPVVRRWKRLLELMAEGKTIRQVAAELECSYKTIERDVAFLRDAFGVPLTSIDDSPGTQTRLLKHICFCCGKEIKP